jgi:hypothetical protein
MPSPPDPTTPTGSTTSRTAKPAKSARAGCSVVGRGVEVPKQVRVVGSDRDKLGERLRQRYENGASIRQLVDQTGRSYGFVHRVLLDAGATLRGRGGARPRGLRRVT